MVMAIKGFGASFLAAGDFMVKEMFSWQIDWRKNSGVRIQNPEKGPILFSPEF
jgi:hypothetical protein